MSSHDAHTVANNTPVGADTGPHCPIGAPMGPIVPAMTLEGRQNALEKSRPVSI